MQKLMKLAAIVLFVAFAAATQKTYEGYKVLHTAPLSGSQASVLQEIMASNELDLDFWTGPVEGASASIMAGNDDLKSLYKVLQSLNVEYDFKIEDLPSLMNATQRPNPNPRGPRSTLYEMNWDNYQSTAVMIDFLDALANNYDFVATERIGTTYEGNDLVYLSITKAGTGKPNIFIDGTAHAREWISPAVVTYLIRELVENHESHPQYLDELNFHFIPVVNPDGYEYSRVGERFWRKTMTGEYDSDCPGVDLNRNFPFKFGVSGSSSSPCSIVYRGPSGFSEVEASSLGEVFESLDPLPVLALSYHSALDLFLYPYGYAYNEYPDNVDEIIELCEASMEALNAVDGQFFSCANAAAIGAASGASDDWYTHKGVRFTYTPELRNNGYGFLLPPEYILPSGLENWAALEVMLDKVLELN